MKTKPILKIGDYVNYSELGRANGYTDESASYGLPTGPFRVIEMRYYKQYEHSPSPWLATIGDPSHSRDLWEEYLVKDVFLSAALNAVNAPPAVKKKARSESGSKNKQGRVVGRRKKELRKA